MRQLLEPVSLPEDRLDDLLGLLGAASGLHIGSYCEVRNVLNIDRVVGEGVPARRVSGTNDNFLPAAPLDPSYGDVTPEHPEDICTWLTSTSSLGRSEVGDGSNTSESR
ncbi:uncharacterized protein L3040_000479 [Drepanopeziza brunnea f. sp. 'multigermtubi']|uniref:uncharacterized protein n=1 Tax=Drepanopeziza brunnea f. sp. 'multigermtubi' TaxID=698441 RepID=UPI00239F5AF5|nr:hypothetical protein L3040_000479 [Drepanopeziza brunnea f. sp. 'multigermtubi']